MEEAYFPPKLKRKDLDEVNDDFCDFSLSSPARKIRRLDAELPPIIEEEETVNPVVFGQPPPSRDNFVEQVVSGSPIAIHELSGSLPENEERAIVLFDPLNNMLPLQPHAPFSFSVNSDFLSGYKSPVLWSNQSNLLKSLVGKQEKPANNSELNSGSLAVVPWVPKQALAEVEAPRMEVVSEMMDADDMEATTMDIEDNYSEEKPGAVFGSVNGGEEWQQHCMIPQLPHNLSTPIAWSAGTGA
ncbi:uncharacterized protein LOC112504730 [Cynara cardunculus var. scolymus]|uniref:Uncharacterized protein n=1 Tax=Cynara cardunculus var. scolymus TaxID=59895 RepID=A0A118HQZ4_CYNCS|nr:uncharacterized protein LOC112504730 [Cynara cardunculus var. scolymus]KVG63136.1 hypothetical protein Ccrd_026315 [Cynara cardunculus var. scolymus]